MSFQKSLLTFKRLTCINPILQNLQSHNSSRIQNVTTARFFFSKFPFAIFSSWLHSDITAIRDNQLTGGFCEWRSDRHICRSALRGSLGSILAPKLSHRVLNRSWTNWDFLRQATLFGIVLLQQRPLNQVMLWIFWVCEHVAVNRC